MDGRANGRMFLICGVMPQGGVMTECFEGVVTLVSASGTGKNSGMLLLQVENDNGPMNFIAGSGSTPQAIAAQTVVATLSHLFKAKVKVTYEPKREGPGTIKMIDLNFATTRA